MIDLTKDNKSIEGTRGESNGHLFLVSFDNKKLLLDGKVFDIHYGYGEYSEYDIRATAILKDTKIINKKILGLISYNYKSTETQFPFFDEHQDGLIMIFKDYQYTDPKELHKELVSWIQLRIGLYYRNKKTNNFVNELMF